MIDPPHVGSAIYNYCPNWANLHGLISPTIQRLAGPNTYSCTAQGPGHGMPTPDSTTSRLPAVSVSSKVIVVRLQELHPLSKTRSGSRCVSSSPPSPPPHQPLYPRWLIPSLFISRVRAVWAMVVVVGHFASDERQKMPFSFLFLPGYVFHAKSSSTVSFTSQNAHKQS